MDEIYSFATINITATGSETCHRIYCEAKNRNPTLRTVRWRIAPQREYVIVQNDLGWQKTFAAESLMRRGWIMQERFLTTRIIHFSKAELVWECRRLAASESYPSGLQ